MTKEQIEMDVYETSHNLDFQYMPWSDKQVAQIIVENINRALTEAEDVAALEMGKGNHIRATDVVLAIRALKIEGKP